jgi:hypothetical protein
MTETPPSVPRRKRRLLSKLLLVLVVLIAIFTLIVALQPADYRVERKATIAAPPPAVFAQVNDFHNWQAWSPWTKLDPSAKNSFEGPSSGDGAIFAWSGNDKIGEGRMTITQSHPTDLVKIKLDFIRPFADTANVDFTFKPEGDQTKVTWGMAGHKNFLGKAVCLFMNMEKMVGPDFERGLAQLKTVSETAAHK